MSSPEQSDPVKLSSKVYAPDEWPADATISEDWLEKIRAGELAVKSGDDQTPKQTQPKFFHIGRYVILIAVFLTVVALVAGYVNRNGIPQLSATSRPVPVSTVIASQPGAVLLLERSGDLSRVIVQPAAQTNWLVPSRDDFTASGPSISQDGSWVAYISQQQGGQVVISSLITNTRYIIQSRQIYSVADNPDTDELKVCTWSPTAWDPTSKRLTFFACGQRRPFSVALIGDLTDPKLTLRRVPTSTVETAEPRQIQWQTSTGLFVQMPDSRTPLTSTFTTIDVSGMFP